MARSLYLVLLVAVTLNVATAQWLDRVSEEARNKAKKDAETCKGQKNVDETYLTALRNGNWQDTNDDKECFILCYISQNENVYDKVNGKITDYYVNDFVKKNFGEKEMKAINDNCNDKRYFDKNDCEGAFEAFKCFHAQGATVL